MRRSWAEEVDVYNYDPSPNLLIYIIYFYADIRKNQNVIPRSGEVRGDRR